MAGIEDVEEWFRFRIPVNRILSYVERKTGQPFAAIPRAGRESQRWHLALREGLRHPLHLNLGIPGIEDPESPIEENACALQAALLLRIPELKVILSGEWELAVGEGLITAEQLQAHEEALGQSSPDLLEL